MKTLFFFIFSGLFAFSSFAVSDISFLFRYYNVENGLSSNRVNALLQDSRNYIWIGTDRGLNRYDGKEFTYYLKGDKRSHGLGDNIILALYESQEKMIWVGTYRGIYIYDHRMDRFLFFDKKTDQGTSISNTYITSITQDRDGLYWITTRGKGVFVYDSQSQSLKQYMLDHSEGHIYQVLVDYSNNIWLAGMSSTYLLDKVNDRFEVFSTDGNILFSTALYEDPMNNLWIGTWEGGLLRLDANRDNPVYFPDPAIGKGILHIHSIIEYNTPGVLLIGSDQGLTVFNTVTGEFLDCTSEWKENRGLSSKFVYPLMKDNEGGIWIGTTYGGVNYLSPHSGQFEGYSTGMVSDQLMSGNVISCFIEDTDGKVWMGCEDGGVNCFSPTKHQFVDFPGREKVRNLHVTGLHRDGEILWISTYANGINSLNIRTGELRQHTAELADYYLYALSGDDKGNMWLGSGHSLYHYNRKSGKFMLIKKVDALINHIQEDPEGRIWLSTSGSGLCRYEPEKDSWKAYTRADGLPIDIVNHSIMDKHGRIWAATDEGLCVYDKGKDDFTYVPLPYSSEDILCILEGGNSLWLTTGKGLLQYNPEDGTLRTYTKSEGLQSEVFICSSGLKTRRGKLFVGTINGFNTFYPHSIHQNMLVPPVILTGLELFNQKVPVEEKGILPARIDQLNEIHLSHNQNVITLFYAALSYCSPEKNQYAYMLEGFDKGWNYVESQARTTYTNLPAGAYTFRVKASNNDNIWNEEGASIRIIVHPPFYLSTPFKILYFLIAILSLFCLLRFLLLRKERKHVAEIESLNASKDKEIHEAKINFFTTIAHEIRTPVSLIIGPLETIRNAPVAVPPMVNDNLETIYRNSQRLLFLINQLLDFRKVEEREIRMHFRKYRIAEVLQAVCERFQASMIQRTIRFRVAYPDPGFEAAIDREAFTKVISNLLSNAYKYARNEVKVSCDVYQERGRFSIRVTDNGEGIDKDVQDQIFKPFFQKTDSKPGTGIGLSIVKDLVEAHNGTIEIDSCMGEYASLTVFFPIEQTVVEKDNLPDNATHEQPVNSLRKDILLPPAFERPTMLIVDDNEEMLQFLGEHFSAYYRIITAIDGEEALQRLKDHEVTLIISDWMMPNMSGLELCKAVRANLLTSHIPFILLTAKTEMQSKIAGLEEGADAYIEKPFSLVYMEARIRNLIEQRELLRTKFSQMPAVPLNSIAGNTADEKFLTRMSDIIEVNIANPDLSVDFLAEQLGISRSGLFAKLKNLANITPNELIHIVRLKKAAALLLEKHYRVNEVCYMVGFKDPSYFSKCFQKQFGIKPNSYAKECRG